MAAGVGKTYRMLLEGHAEQEAGRDVVIGLLETHGREETGRRGDGHPGRAAAARDLPRHRPRPTWTSPPSCAAAPEVALVDELAHTNAPGLEHEKRYEDIEDLLDAGIDVLSTVNVQHLESLNDQVAELSGARVRETVPDSVLGRADEVVLIDLSPEALLARLRAGKVYKPERVDAALNGFFRIENLAALREIALRQVAEEVEAKRLVTEVVGTREDTLAADLPAGRRRAPARARRALPGLAAARAPRVALGPAPRRPARPAVGRAPGPRADPEQERQLAALRQLASVLGATLLVEPGDDVADTVARVARERGTTYILMGRSRPARGLARLRVPLPQRLMQALPGVDVRIVADRSLRHEKTP